MALLDHLRDLREDIRRHRDVGKGAPSRWNRQELLLCIEAQGVWAAGVYRYGRWIYERDRGYLGLPLKTHYRTLNKLVEVLAGVSIPASAKIGPGLFVGHFGPVIIHPNVSAGRNLSVGQGVTLGTRGTGGEAAPTLGDDVYVGVGAKILGGVKVGNGAKIGANAVVLHDVPEGATVVGVPARAVQRGGERGA